MFKFSALLEKLLWMQLTVLIKSIVLTNVSAIGKSLEFD